MTEPSGRTGASRPRLTAPARASFVVRAFYGPPRPVLVLAVTGEVDRTNDAEMIAAVRRTAELARTPPGHLPREEFGCRSVARTVVVDLRGVGFIGARALGRLAFARDGAGDRIRIVIPRDGVIRRALAVIGPCRVYADLTDAVLSEVDPTRPVTD